MWPFKDKIKEQLDSALSETSTLRAEMLKMKELIDGYTAEPQLIAKPGRPILFVKMGDQNRAWLPGPKQIAAVKRALKEAKVDETYNIVVTHWAVEYGWHNVDEQNRAWLPGPKQIAAVKRALKEAKVDETYNIVVTPWAVEYGWHNVDEQKKPKA